ncbi:aldo/keto reductase [Agromyces bauzanensis]
MDASRRSSLRATGVEISALGLGAGSLAAQDGPGSLFEVLDHALSRGLNFADTAPLYLAGDSERWLGEYCRRHPGAALSISTKVGRYPAPAGQRTFDYSFATTLASVERSLDRLGVSSLDLVIIHDVDREMHDDIDRAYAAALEGAYPALEKLRRDGVVRAIGISTRQPDIAQRALGDGAFDAIMMAGAYTLLHHAPLTGLFDRCLETDCGVLVASPFNSGILASGSADSPYDYGRAGPEIVRRVTAMSSAAERYGIPLAAAALQFSLAHPAVVSVVAGHRTAAEIDRNIASLALPIPDAFWQDLLADGLLPQSAPLPAGSAA